MTVTKPQVVTVVGFIMGSLLLVFATSCSFDNQTMDDSNMKRAEEVLVVQAQEKPLEKQSEKATIEQQAQGKPLKKQPEKVSFEEQTREKPIEGQTEEEVFVANLFCSACHYAFGEDELALDHERVGIGCERCHGESERHRSDENNITPPEIMYPKAKINPTCMMCHPRGKIKHVSSHASLLAGAETIFDKSNNQKKHCTDCHGENHRINVRTIRWNKATGEMLDEE
jgi:hypothetical protein